jgi:hypothetical protein
MGVVFALALLFIAVVFALNAFDEELTPETNAMLVPPVNRYRSDDNIYVALRGFDAPAGQSIIEAGETRPELVSMEHLIYETDDKVFAGA